MADAVSSLVGPTHDPKLRSWVDDANGHPDFPVQNLPLCVFMTGEDSRAGVVIGEHILDLEALGEDVVGKEDRELIAAVAAPTLNGYCALAPSLRSRFRAIVSSLLSDPESPLRAQSDRVLVQRAEAALQMPVAIGDYTDFFAGIHHARNAGRMFRPDNPLLPNYYHVPIAYHGRASSIAVSGTDFVRPFGQTAAHGSTEPQFGPSRRVDFELELAIWLGGGNALGSPIAIGEAGDAIVGFGLLNDWSARDIQAWETQPLGPFLGKNFMSSVSPFLVTLEALAPFRAPMQPRPGDVATPMAYLLDDADQASGMFETEFEVLLSTSRMREAGEEPVRLTRACGLDLVWTPAQMIAHHTVTGCNLRPGDLIGTGTISSASADGHGSMLEMSSGGREPISLPNGETRSFLEDGDEVIMRGWCEKDGFARIGLGEVRGTLRENPRAAK